MQHIILVTMASVTFAVCHAARADDPPPPPGSVQTVQPEEAEAILGRNVTGPDGKDIGRLVDVLVDRNGQPQAAVIDFGGFMGVGSRKVAVHWSALRFNPGGSKHQLTLEMTPDQIKAAPEFSNSGEAAPVVTPSDAAARSAH
nr:PRC-barrel domain-containing protein [uncultured Rhodopila sp.]